MRDPESGQNAFKTELFAEVVVRIHESETDVVINRTGGNGGAIVIDDNKPGEWQESSDLTTPKGAWPMPWNCCRRSARCTWA